MSNDWIVPWSGVGAKYCPEEIQTVVDVMKNADPLTQGPHQKNFEKSFQNYIGSKSAFAVSSCTAALQMASDLIQFRPGEEVIIPGHTFCASAIPFARSGAKIVWADIDPDSRVVTLETIEKCLTPKTKAIVVVHLYGLAVDLDPIMEMARKKNIYVVEDCAQAPGAIYKDRKLGSIGDFGCFSFHTHKNISTLGEGGILTVNKEELIAKIPGFRHNGVRGFEGQEHYWQPGMSDVDFDVDGLLPHNFCLGEAQCALGAKMLERLDQMNHDRKSRANKIIQALKGFPELSFQKANHEACENVYHLLVARYDGDSYGKTQDDLFKLLAYEYKIKVINPYYPLYKYPLFKKLNMGDAICPNTDDYFNHIVAFPFHHWLTDHQIEYMIKSIQQALESLRK